MLNFKILLVKMLNYDGITFNYMKNGWVSIQLKELKREKKKYPSYRVNFGLGEEKERSIGKNQLVRIRRPFYYRLEALDLNIQA